MVAIPKFFAHTNSFAPPLPSYQRLTRAEEVARHLGGATKTSNGFDCRCPAHDDKKASLSLSDAEDKLLFKCHAGCEQGEIAQALKDMGFVLSSRTVDRQEPPPKPEKPSVFRPSEKIEPPTIENCSIPGSIPSHLHHYFDEHGHIINAVARYEKNGVKTFLPWSWNGSRWVTKQFPAGERPLYGLHKAAKNPSATIIITEGEKAADALQGAIGDGYVVMTWSGGASAVESADWSPIAGREIIIWGDADEPGKKAAEKVAQIHKGKSRILKIDASHEKGWDAADAVAQGWAKDKLLAFVLPPDNATEKPPHPLAQFVNYTTKTVEPIIYLIDNVIEAKFCLVAGSAGAGKTTQLIPLYARCTHLVTDHTMRPSIRRRVVYIAEDVRQATRVISSMRLSGEIACSDEDLRDWFRVVEAKRLKADVIAQVVEDFEKLYHMNIGENDYTYNAPPLVVFDTGSSNFDLENESDNSEVAKAIATLKQRFGNIPVTVVVHIAKALKRSDVKDFSARGAGAWEADVQQVMYLASEDDGTRWLEIQHGKHRFATEVAGVRFTAGINHSITLDVLGKPQNVVLLHGQPEVVLRDERDSQVKEVRDQKDKKADAATRAAIQTEIRSAWDIGQPIALRDLKASIKGSSDRFKRIMDEMKAEKWVYEISIGKDSCKKIGRSIKSNKGLFCLSSDEHTLLIQTGEMTQELVAKLNMHVD
jgi:hypothetical protein